MLFFLVRHGDPVYNPDSLTPLGKRQAEAVAKRLSLYGVDKIFASTSTRAYETAIPTSELLKKEIITLDWCNESHAWRELTTKTETGRTTWCFQHKDCTKKMNSPEVRALAHNWYDHEYFLSTTLKQGIERIQIESDNFFSELGYVHDRQNFVYSAVNPTDMRIALFAHQGFGLAFLSALLDIPYPLFSTHFDIGHSGITVIEFDNKEGDVVPKVLQLSSDAHIYREGLPTNYQNRIRF